ncbi:helix-turn-helix transcriptional regulator [Bradyrhizobium monzae]|uniref:helix-turn-helix transcriptional regulator n=1 Tax=Bradyrhizobium sp. Oc8 TaxID=2876780 RepID=UPI0023EE2C22|nr:AlpA family phage regulatory protein [Bradyrhizobium sp. Oc8]
MNERPIIFLRRPEVLRRTGLGKTTIRQMMLARTFPRSVQLSEKCVGWREDLVDDWLRAKDEGRAITFDHPELKPQKRVRS